MIYLIHYETTQGFGARLQVTHGVLQQHVTGLVTIRHTP